MGQKNWVTFIKHILNECNLSHVWAQQNVHSKKPPLDTITKTLRFNYEKSFFTELNKVTGK